MPGRTGIFDVPPCGCRGISTAVQRRTPQDGRRAVGTRSAMRLSTAEKVNAGFIVALGIVAVFAIASIASIWLFHATSQEVRRTHDVLTVLQRMLAELSSAESAQLAFIITGNETFLEPYQDAHRLVTQRILRLREETFEDEDQQRRLAVLSSAASQRLRLMNEIVETRRGDFDSAVQMVATGRGIDVSDVIRSEAAAFEAVELARLEAGGRRAAARARLATLVIGGGGAFTFLVVLGAAVAIRRDYTERRRAEQALRDNETLLSQFMENLPIGVMVIDADGHPRFANNAAAAILGPRVLIDTGEAPLPLLRDGGGEAYPLADTPVQRALLGEIASIDDAVVEAPDGLVPVEVSAAPVYDASGRIAYAITAFNDITERRRSDEALRTAKEAAETASRAKSEFLARMSHELRTPLNSVIGFANILLRKRAGTLSGQDTTYVERILENGKHLLLLINDILDLAKIEAGKIEVTREPVDLQELIASVCRQWDGQLAAGNVVLRTAVPEGLDALPSDGARLRQILVNLIGNAVKFTEQGSIEVEVETGPDPRQPRAIHVRDTGIGIPADRLEAIFDTFEQAESTTARKYGGTGLGLPISRALCALLGYELSVRSAVGRGTSFCVDLAPEPADPILHEDDAAEPAARTAHGIADDGGE
jgi:signal transduction histidine kinase/CHASE3 domain sensor protein